MKKILAFVLSFVLISNMGIPAYGAENVCENTRDSSSIMPRASTIPTEVHSLPYTMTVTNLKEKHSTYSRYYFAPCSDETLTVEGSFSPSGTDDGVARSAKILLFQVGSSSNIDSYTVSNITDYKFFSHTFSGLNPNSHYYFRIDNQNPDPPYADRYIDGSIKVY